MKKFIMALVCLMTMVLNVNAEEYTNSVAEKNGWVLTTHEADELIGNDEYNSLVYVGSENKTIVLWDDNDKDFRIICNDGNIFDYKVGSNGWSLNTNMKLFVATIGYYDSNNKLLKKKECGFRIEGNASEARSIKYGMGGNEGKRIVAFLKNEKGYIRIIAPLFNTRKNFDFKVPCLNN